MKLLSGSYQAKVVGRAEEAGFRAWHDGKERDERTKLLSCQSGGHRRSLTDSAFDVDFCVNKPLKRLD